MQQQIQEIQSKLSKKLSEKRFTHTIGVLYTAEALAMRYGEDLDKYRNVCNECVLHFELYFYVGDSAFYSRRFFD